MRDVKQESMRNDFQSEVSEENDTLIVSVEFAETSSNKKNLMNRFGHYEIKRSMKGDLLW